MLRNQELHDDVKLTQEQHDNILRNMAKNDDAVWAILRQHWCNPRGCRTCPLYGLVDGFWDESGCYDHECCLEDLMDLLEMWKEEK